MKPVLTAHDVARLLAINEITVYRLARNGRLPAFKVGGQWRFGREQLEQWMAHQMRLRQSAHSGAEP